GAGRRSSPPRPCVGRRPANSRRRSNPRGVWAPIALRPVHPFLKRSRHMKMVVAYVDPDRFDEIREDLLELGFLSISVLSASGSTPEATVTGSYRGAKLERHLRPKSRIEAVVADEASATVVEAIPSVGGAAQFG